MKGLPIMENLFGLFDIRLFIILTVALIFPYFIMREKLKPLSKYYLARFATPILIAYLIYSLFF
jgi:dolichyl-phosphate-mannose--protein O-mannosyl transferase